MLNPSAILNLMAVTGQLRPGILSPEMEQSGKILTQTDLDDYKRRIGEKSPTANDAMMFAALSMKLSKKLIPSVMTKYNDAILRFKKITDDDGTAASTIAEIESQALSEDPKVVTKMADAITKQNLFHNHGQRVRLREGHRCGTVYRPPNTYLLVAGTSGAELDIQFDDIPEGETTQVHECDLQLLCSGVGCNKHGHLMCAKCKQRMFCSVDCQKADWEGHKKMCKKYRGPT